MALSAWQQMVLDRASANAPRNTPEVALFRSIKGLGTSQGNQAKAREGYDVLRRSGIGSADIATDFNEMYGTEWDATTVDNLLAGFDFGGVIIGQDGKPVDRSLPQFSTQLTGSASGLPNMTYDQGGEMTNPQLRDVYSEMQRRSRPDYDGETDRIKTSGRGLLTTPMLQRRLLTGR